MRIDRRLPSGRRRLQPVIALLLFGMVLPAPLRAAEAPQPSVEAQSSYQVIHPDGLAARLLGDQPSPVRGLDPAIFTELSPVTASEPAVRLPDDQEDDE